MRPKQKVGVGVLAAWLALTACSGERTSQGTGGSAVADSGATRGATLLPDSGTPGTSPVGPSAAARRMPSTSTQSSGGAERPSSGTGAATTDSARSGTSTGAKRPIMRPPPLRDTSSRPVPRPQLPKP